MYLRLFVTFLKLGAFVFGSGQALAGAMQNEIVEKRGWLTAEQFADGWSSANVLPGPIAPKVVAYVGYQQAGSVGAVVAAVAYLIPSVTGMVFIAALLTRDPTNETGFVAQLRQGPVRGIKPAVLALLVDAFIGFTGVAIPSGAELGSYWLPFGVIVAGIVMSLAGTWWLAGATSDGEIRYLLTDGRAIGIFALSLLALMVLRIDTIYVMLGAAALGYTYLLF